MKENELKFIELVEASNANFVIKLERALKTQVLSQLSRQMLLELFTYYKDYVDQSFNPKAVCMQCAASLFNVTKRVAHKYFELKDIQNNELKLEEENQKTELDLIPEVIEEESVEEPIVIEKTEIIEPSIEEKITKRGRPKSK